MIPSREISLLALAASTFDAAALTVHYLARLLQMYFLHLVIVLFQTCEEEHSNIKIEIINASTHTSLLRYLYFSALISKAAGRVWVGVRLKRNTSKFNVSVPSVIICSCWLNMLMGLRQITLEKPSRSFMYMS
jgi:hypothetical protein